MDAFTESPKGAEGYWAALRDVRSPDPDDRARGVARMISMAFHDPDPRVRDRTATFLRSTGAEVQPLPPAPLPYPVAAVDAAVARLSHPLAFDDLALLLQVVLRHIGCDYPAVDQLLMRLGLTVSHDALGDRCVVYIDLAPYTFGRTCAGVQCDASDI